MSALDRGSSAGLSINVNQSYPLEWFITNVLIDDDLSLGIYHNSADMIQAANTYETFQKCASYHSHGVPPHGVRKQDCSCNAPALMRSVSHFLAA